MKSTTELEPVTAVTAAHAPLWARAVATFCGVGYLRPGPGTWASAATVLCWAWLAPLTAARFRPAAAAVAAAAATLAGIPAATRVARSTGKQDPGIVVIDEVAGQMIALIAVPLGWKSLLASLILFRAFDITKPPPLRRLEKVPEGAGIVLDDLGAGVYALLVVQLLLYSGVIQ